MIWESSLVIRSTDYGHQDTDFFFENSKLLGLGRQIGPNVFGAFGVFSIELCISPLSMFFIIQPLCLQKTKPLFPLPNIYLGLGFEFGQQRIGI